jgi:hypothetical protein
MPSVTGQSRVRFTATMDAAGIECELTGRLEIGVVLDFLDLADAATAARITDAIAASVIQGAASMAAESALERDYQDQVTDLYGGSGRGRPG